RRYPLNCPARSTDLRDGVHQPTIFGTHEEKTLAQLRDVATRAERVALRADGHLGYVMPIGGVAAYRNKVRVVGVGFDIACGTVGGGNHYVDVFADENRDIWVGVHFGSRGLGHTVASGFLSLSQGKQWGERVPEVEVLLALDQPLGHDYWHLMTLAGEYAYAGREWVARKVVSLLGGRELELVHNHHNFAWKETHDGTEYVVVRKGATPAFPGQKGFVGGSMGDDAVIIEGARHDSALQRASLYSTVHGA